MGGPQQVKIVIDTLYEKDIKKSFSLYKYLESHTNPYYTHTHNN